MRRPYPVPPRRNSDFRRVAILFAGGPAPAANAVISTAANSFLRNDIEVIGIMNGYSHLVRVRPGPAAAGRVATTSMLDTASAARARATRRAS